MIATVPQRCDCGGELYAEGYSYEEPIEVWGCGDCDRNDEQIAEQHNTTECTVGGCEWCAFIEEATR